jgi:hypothetical protein
MLAENEPEETVAVFQMSAERSQQRLQNISMVTSHFTTFIPCKTLNRIGNLDMIMCWGY